MSKQRARQLHRKGRARPPRRAPAWIGAPPGELVSDPQAAPPDVALFVYGPDRFEEHIEVDAASLVKWRGRNRVVWVDVAGLANVDAVRQVGTAFGLHPLALEDVVHLGQRPKIDEYDGHLFVVSHLVSADPNVPPEQVSIFVGDGFVVTFQERPGDCFEPIRNRIRGATGRVRREGADYLAYALLDAVVDQLAVVTATIGDHLEVLETALLAHSEDGSVERLITIRHEILAVRRLCVPLRDVLARLAGAGMPLFTAETRLYLRDCHDHGVRVVDDLDGWRDFSASLMDLHIALSGQQLNGVMKTLTIIATIFMPLSFIAGVYGMNFDTASPFNMPELGWDLGYAYVLLVMGIVVSAQLMFFRAKGWLGARS
ncbi:MAG: magnesium transporter [Myxococcota bacterium]|jgi:magnesium transporter